MLQYANRAPPRSSPLPCPDSQANAIQFRNGKLCYATIQTNDELGKYPNNRPINIPQSEKVDGDLSRKLAQVL